MIGHRAARLPHLQDQPLKGFGRPAIIGKVRIVPETEPAILAWIAEHHTAPSARIPQPFEPLADQFGADPQPLRFRQD